MTTQFIKVLKAGNQSSYVSILMHTDGRCTIGNTSGIGTIEDISKALCKREDHLMAILAEDAARVAAVRALMLCNGYKEVTE